MNTTNARKAWWTKGKIRTVVNSEHCAIDGGERERMRERVCTALCVEVLFIY